MSWDKVKNYALSNVVAMVVGVIGTGLVLLFGNLVTPRGEFLLLKSSYEAHVAITHNDINSRLNDLISDGRRRDIILEGILRAYCFESSREALQASGLMPSCESVGIRK